MKIPNPKLSKLRIAINQHRSVKINNTTVISSPSLADSPSCPKIAAQPQAPELQSENQLNFLVNESREQLVQNIVHSQLVRDDYQGFAIRWMGNRRSVPTCH